jgi:hypothetical protein
MARRLFFLPGFSPRHCHQRGNEQVDAVLALQVVVGAEPQPPIPMTADTDLDGRIGMNDALFVLQRVAGVR